jgi:hypothetical protein
VPDDPRIVCSLLQYSKSECCCSAKPNGTCAEWWEAAAIAASRLAANPQVAINRRHCYHHPQISTCPGATLIPVPAVTRFRRQDGSCRREQGSEAREMMATAALQAAF